MKTIFLHNPDGSRWSPRSCCWDQFGQCRKYVWRYPRFAARGSLIVRRMLPEVAYVIIAAGFASGITYLNVRGIRATARTNDVLLVFMGIVLLVFIGPVVRYSLGHEGSFLRVSG